MKWKTTYDVAITHHVSRMLWPDQVAYNLDNLQVAYNLDNLQVAYNLDNLQVAYNLDNLQVAYNLDNLQVAYNLDNLQVAYNLDNLQVAYNLDNLQVAYNLGARPAIVLLCLFHLILIRHTPISHILALIVSVSLLKMRSTIIKPELCIIQI